MKIKRKILVILVLFLFVSINCVVAADPNEDQQWYLGKINAEQAWNITKGEPEIIVAVLDTGVDIDHPDLKDNIWKNNDEIAGDELDNDNNGFIDDVYGWNFVDDNNLVEPQINSFYDSEAVKHGTILSGLITAIHDNDFGIKGVASKVRIMPLVVLNAVGFGGSKAVADAVNYAVDNGADVINLSFGGYDSKEYGLRTAILKANNKNVSVVAASGNNIDGGVDLEEKKIYPVSYDEEWDTNAIIGVASTDQSNRISHFSNYGEVIDISAPGENIISIVFQSSKRPELVNYVQDGFNGTSFSTALVSGTIALMKSINNNLSNNDVLTILRKTATKIDFQDSFLVGKYGAGLLNTGEAVKETLNNYEQKGDLKFFIAPDEGRDGKIVNYDGNFVWQKDIEVFDGVEGLNINMADLDNDGLSDIVAGSAPDNLPFVRGLTIDEELIESFLAFENDFRGGVKVTAGRVDGSGNIAYVVVPQTKRKSVVRIFNYEGTLQKEFSVFNGVECDGLNVVLADVQGDEREEIIVGSPEGISAEIQIYNNEGQLLKKIQPFTQSFKGGVNVGAGNFDNDSQMELVAGAGEGGGPHVRVIEFDGTGLVSLFAYNQNFRGGVRLATGDFNGDGIDEIITAPGKTGGPHIRIWSTNVELLSEFFAYEASFTAGIQVVVR